MKMFHWCFSFSNINFFCNLLILIFSPFFFLFLFHLSLFHNFSRYNSRVIDKIDQSEFEGFEYVNPLLMSLEDCVWHHETCQLHPYNNIQVSMTWNVFIVFGFVYLQREKNGSMLEIESLDSTFSKTGTHLYCLSLLETSKGTLFRVEGAKNPWKRSQWPGMYREPFLQLGFSHHYCQNRGHLTSRFHFNKSILAKNLRFGASLLIAAHLELLWSYWEYKFGRSNPTCNVLAKCHLKKLFKLAWNGCTKGKVAKD